MALKGKAAKAGIELVGEAVEGLTKTFTKKKTTKKKAYKGRKRGRKPKSQTTTKPKTTKRTTKTSSKKPTTKGQKRLSLADKNRQKLLNEREAEKQMPRKRLDITGLTKLDRLLIKRRKGKEELTQKVKKAMKEQGLTEADIKKLPAGSARAPAPKVKGKDQYTLTRSLKYKPPGSDTYEYINVPRAVPKRDVEKVDKFLKSLSAEDKKLIIGKTRGDFRKLKRISRLLTGDEAAGMARTSGVTKTGKTVKKIFFFFFTTTQVRDAMGYVKDKLKSADIPKKTKDQKIEAIKKLLDQGYPFKTKGTKQSTKQTFDDIMKSFGTGKDSAGIVANTPKGRKTGGKVGMKATNTRIRRTSPRGIGAAKRGYGKAMKG